VAPVDVGGEGVVGRLRLLLLLLRLRLLLLLRL
jgi:hypothetical protein